MQTMMTTFDNKSRIVGTLFYFMVTLLEKCNLFMMSRPDRLIKNMRLIDYLFVNI